MKNPKGLEGMVIRYFYLRGKPDPNVKNSRGKPIVSVCLLTDKKMEMVARGISICSFLDMGTGYKIKDGRDHALKRACAVWFRKDYDTLILRPEALDSIYGFLGPSAWKNFFGDNASGFQKADILPFDKLNDIEKSILKGKDK